jgi:predicted PurR-regulated permease PerM
MTVWLKGRASISAGILTGLTPVFVIVPLALIGVAFAQQVAGMVNWMKGRRLLPLPAILDGLSTHPAIGGPFRWLRQNTSIGADDVQGWIISGAQSALESAAGMSGAFTLGVLGSVVGFFMTLFLLFFFLRDGRLMLQSAMRFVPIHAADRSNLLAQLGELTRAVIFGQTATAVVQGTLVGIGFAIAGLPSPVVFGVLATIASLLPVGSAVVLIPAIVYLAFAQRWGMAIFLLIWSLGVGVSDNLLRPVLTAQRAEVSTLAIFTGAIGGASAFGVLGLIIGPVLVSFAVALLRFAQSRMSDSP